MRSADSEQVAAGWAALLTWPTHVRLILGGQVDAAVTELNEAITEALGHGLPVEVDTRQVTFMDSLAMAALARLAAAQHEPLRFINPPDLVRFLLQVTRIGQVVQMEERRPRLADCHLIIVRH